VWKQRKKEGRNTNEKRKRKGKEEIAKERIKMSKINQNKSERKGIF
jgi:hypothetical protein